MSDGDQTFPVQEQEYPGTTEAMAPRPDDEMRQYAGAGSSTASGRSSRAVTPELAEPRPFAFAKVGGDLSHEDHCGYVVRETVAGLGGLDILVNNNGLRGNKSLIDYSVTKGAISPRPRRAVTRRRIRSADAHARGGQPDEIAPSYVFLPQRHCPATHSGEVLAPIGGETLPG